MANLFCQVHGRYGICGRNRTPAAKPFQMIFMRSARQPCLSRQDLYGVPAVLGQQPQPAGQSLPAVEHHIVAVKIAVACPAGGHIPGNVHDAGVLHGVHDRLAGMT